MPTSLMKDAKDKILSKLKELGLQRDKGIKLLNATDFSSLLGMN